MKIYLVGGAVRDKLLGIPVKEQDWVVVGGTVDEMLAQGFKQVGKEFPVFLHPGTQEEYALARRERKVKPGYQGFAFDVRETVSLEDDLKRRDLTINAMAETVDGKLIDPYHGKQDLEQKILRHVSPAFAEDPVRILRVGRFLARYAGLGFEVAEETYALMCEMVRSGEVNALVPERVWKELERALREPNPQQFFEVLAKCGALRILFPHLTMNGFGIKALIAASALSSESTIRFAALLHDLPEENNDKSSRSELLNQLCSRYRVPNAHRELAQLTARFHETLMGANTLSAEDLLKLFYATDVFRRENRFQQLLMATAAIAKSKQITFSYDWLMLAVAEIKSLNIKLLISKIEDKAAVPEAIFEHRLERLQAFLNTHKCL